VPCPTTVRSPLPRWSMEVRGGMCMYMCTTSPRSPCPVASPPRTYARHEPETTVLHVVVREHLETFLATVQQERGRGLRRYVENELRCYLDCGILARGFLRVLCTQRSEEIVVAFSCKCRGACPSCSARRMGGTAAHLVDHVLPDVALRQWGLTGPNEIRRALALRPDALTAQNRIFVQELARWQKQKAAALGILGGETAAVTFVQRFNATPGRDRRSAWSGCRCCPMGAWRIGCARRGERGRHTS
jgi:hypothetical protein